ncbi:oxygen-independent coproporphyrinogen III oxidase [Halobacteriovorax sp. RT-2-6]|uniref:oxygen-independent coproporphyrinogen III oxidase n=1 Tax=unclassified Halobacteriovorax TaxID=2639665 RepID=UPI00399A179D
MIKDSLVQKYNVPVPRYTSFPAVPYWTGAPSQEMWFEHIKEGYDKSQGVELYIHVPFCEKLCYYCGCHRVISKNKNRGIEYVDFLLREWELYLEQMGDINISSIHLGGGTPNFLNEEAFSTLLDKLKESIDAKEFKGSIEIDPRTCSKSQLDLYKKLGFSRLSMGIQDFDPVVQEAIGRIQPFEKVKELVDYCREIGIDDINFDLIYGLPYQTLDTVEATIEKVISLKPLQIAFYSYAHLPSKIKNQKLIPEEALPEGALKRALYEHGKGLLENHSYKEIGLDHFAKSNSQLYQAKQEGKLRRNFMGHTHKSSPIIIGLGCSSISSSAKSFVQNEKNVKTYFESISKRRLAISTGHIHTQEDIVVEEILQNFFATNSVSKKDWQSLKNASHINSKICELEEDGLITNSDKIIVTDDGRPFMRNIASIFDHHLMRSKQNSGSRAL